ncbi:hypothetical protein DYI42_21255 [Vannielia litorea]|nr:hypothetical protein [Vannielia litorea]
MSDQDDPKDHQKRTEAEGPSVVYLRFPRMSQLPPDEWFEDAEGDAAVLRAEEERLARLSARRMGRL